MSKFKVRFKLTGLEFEVEGDRAETGAISRSVAQQFGALLQPATQIVGGSQDIGTGAASSAPAVQQIEGSLRRKSRARRGSTAAGDGPASEIVEFVHDTRFGIPLQSWNTATKSLWLLYVLKEIKEVQELSARQIADTFNKYFRQSGLIKSFNVTRDLGKLKAHEKPTPVSDNSNGGQEKWFLTIDGIRRAQALVADALAPTTTNAD